MSSILKALKKLEQEKAARKPDSFRIDAEILRGTSPRSYISRGASLAAVAIFLCGVGATYLLMKHDQMPVAVQPSHASKSGMVTGDSSDGTSLFPASTLPAAGPLPRQSGKVTSVSEKSEPASRPMEKNQRVKPAEIVPQTGTPEQTSVTPPVPVAPLVPPAKPVLKINGIAFQDGADSVAVINGITVSNGSVIEGARVEEIQKDRVRFSRGGEKFDIILDKSN